MRKVLFFSVLCCLAICAHAQIPAAPEAIEVSAKHLHGNIYDVRVTIHAPGLFIVGPTTPLLAPCYRPEVISRRWI